MTENIIKPDSKNVIRNEERIILFEFIIGLLAGLRRVI
jgi:hypothetical protein